MAVIKNKLRQRIAIDLGDGKAVGLLAGGTVKVADSALSSRFMKRYLEKGSVVILNPGSGKKGKGKKTREVKEKKGGR